MEFFKNVVRQEEPNSTLFGPEIDVILAVAEQVTTAINPKINRGYFILDGQRFDQDAQLIVRGELPAGEAERKLKNANYRFSEEGIKEYSSQITARAIDEALLWSGLHDFKEDQVFSCDELDAQLLDPKRGFFAPCFADAMIFLADELRPTSRIFHWTTVQDDLTVMLLNCEHGRFLMSAHLGADEHSLSYHNESIGFLCGVAAALGRLDSIDQVLQQSVQRVADSVHGPASETAFETVQRLFAETVNPLPTIADWQEWVNGKKDELTAFFN